MFGEFTQGLDSHCTGHGVGVLLQEDMGAGAFTYDDSYWPLLLLRLEGHLSDQEFEKFFAHGHATLERREQYVSVFDLSRTVLPSGEQRQKQTQWMREHEPFLREYLLGTAFVVSTVDEGVAWAVARLKQSGLSTQAEHIRHRYFPRR